MDQPGILFINENLRLRKISDSDYKIAFSWYQDLEVLKGTAGPNRVEPYDKSTLVSMYKYLATIGECYIIEILDSTAWLPIGDVTLAKDTLPIVIGNKTYWGKGIGKQVISALLDRARELGFKNICLNEIYFDNERSKRLYESCGFKKVGSTSDAYLYRIDLE